MLRVKCKIAEIFTLYLSLYTDPIMLMLITRSKNELNSDNHNQV